jgi:hypothetical protein
MRFTGSIGVLGTFALLSGCSGGSLAPASSLPTSSGANAGSQIDAHAAADPDGRLVFFANSKNNDIEVYQRTNNHIVGHIAGLKKPIGLAVDNEELLYVANSGASNIPVYTIPYTGAPTETLDDSGFVPHGVAISADGTVAVTNACSTANKCPEGSGSIQFYAKGSTTPCSTILTPDYDTVAFGAFDKAGEFYFDGPVRKKVMVSIVQGGCAAASYNMLAADYAIKAPGSMQFGPHGNLSIIDPTSETIDTFAATTDQLTKVSVTTLNGNFVISPTAFALTGSGKTVFTVNTGGGSAQKFQFPEGGDPQVTFSIGDTPSGVAVAPAFPL